MTQLFENREFQILKIIFTQYYSRHIYILKNSEYTYIAEKIHGHWGGHVSPDSLMALLLNKHNTYFLVIIFEILIHQQCDKWCNKVVTHTKQRERERERDMKKTCKT